MGAKLNYVLRFRLPSNHSIGEMNLSDIWSAAGAAPDDSAPRILQGVVLGVFALLYLILVTLMTRAFALNEVYMIIFRRKVFINSLSHILLQKFLT